MEGEILRWPQQERLRKACRQIVLATSDGIEGDSRQIEDVADGWLDFYSYEPLGKLVTSVHAAIKAVGTIAPLRLWDWRLFGPEGHVYCYADGREQDDNSEPIDGTDALQSYLDSLKSEV
jgi:hypothetical protein